MSARMAVKAAQAVVKQGFDVKLVVDGVWGRISESTYKRAPDTIQYAAQKASADLGYNLDSLRERAIGVTRKTRIGNDFDFVLAQARASGLTGESLVNFMATVVAETNAVNVVEYGYRYDQAVKQFGSAMNGVSRDASSEEIFNRVYARRAGNTTPGDGWKFRGRGYIQLTGRANYTEFSRETGIDVLNNPDAITGSKELAVKAALWFWKKNVVGRSMDLDIAKATLAVRGRNGGDDIPRRRDIARSIIVEA